MLVARGATRLSTLGSLCVVEGPVSTTAIWLAIVALMTSVLGAATRVGAADVEAEAWRNVVRALEPAERTSRILYVENLAKTRAPGVAKVLAYLAENEPDADIKAVATRGLVRLKDPATESALRRLRTTGIRSPWLCRATCRSLESISSGSARPFADLCHRRPI